MADVRISQLSDALPNKSSAIIPFSDGSTTYKTSPSGIVAASPGCLLQVIYAYSNTTSSDNSNTWITCPNLTAEITPKSTSSKILVRVISHFGNYNSNDGYLRVLRDGVVVSPLGISGSGLQASAGGQASGDYMIHLSTEFLDQPNIVNKISYTIQGYIQTTTLASNSLTWNRSRGTSGPEAGTAISSISLMEIAG